MITNELSTNHEGAINLLSPEEHTFDCATAAMQYLQSGLSLIPVQSIKKSPIITSWKQYQKQLPTTDEVSSWDFSSGTSIAIICGAISGNLEMIDFDQKYYLGPTTIFEEWKNLVDTQRPGLVDRLIHESTQSNGDHIYYRCSVIEGNLKLAKRPATDDELSLNKMAGPKTIIETRGEGGYVLCYPSRGYRLLAGEFTRIPEITPDERSVLLDCARALNTCISKQIEIEVQHRNSENSERPGDVFNERGSISETLLLAGWQKVGGNGINEYWRRPGKADGISATYHMVEKKFYVWSSNAAPFDSERAYKPFTVYALLKHNGDFSKATIDAASQGFGKLRMRVNGKPTLAEVEEFLLLRYAFRRNVITQKIEMRAIAQGSFQEMSDYELNSIHRELHHADLPLSIDALDRLLRSDFTLTYDPFQQYFEAQEPWDETTDYIEELSKTIVLEDETERDKFKTYLKKWIVAQVASAIIPSVVNHTVLVLVGAQGQGKTTWLQRLIPPPLEQYRFLGTIDPSNKDTLVYLARTLLINVDELETFSKGDLGRLKSIITQPEIQVRLPYGRIWETLPRRASFVASVNPKNFLNDPTGARRFLVFNINSIQPYHTVDMNGVYMQAYSLLNRGEVYYFTPDEIQEVNERNKSHYKQGYEHELVVSIYQPGDPDKDLWFTSTEIAEYIRSIHESFRVDSASVRNIGYAMTHEGFKKKRSGGVTKYCVRKV